MIEDKLEIVIPTYNRANYLNNTLNSLLNSPFKDCKITVRDNASTDETPEICGKYSKLFKNMNIIRNYKNIGGNANILRSYEQATYKYVWVLADNDILNFSRCEDFIEAIESGKYDLIICNSAVYSSDGSRNYNPPIDGEPISEYIKQNNKNKENYLENTTQELASIIKEHYFIIAGFVSSTIYKTSLIDTDTLILGSKYIAYSYPHFPLIVKAIEKNCLTYKTKYEAVFVRENPGDTEINHLSWYSNYLNCLSLIKDKQLRSYAECHGRKTPVIEIPARIIYAKSQDTANIKREVILFIKAMYEIKGWFIGFLFQILILLSYAVPTKLCKYYVKKRENK